MPNPVSQMHGTRYNNCLQCLQLPRDATPRCQPVLTLQDLGRRNARTKRRRIHGCGRGKGGQLEALVWYGWPRSTTHFIEDCPTRPKHGFACWNCGGQHPVQECEDEFDAVRIFANKKASKEKWASRTPKGKGEEGEATASIQVLATLPTGVPCPAPTYIDTIVPKIAPGVDVTIKSVQDGKILGFFSDREAEIAYAKLEAHEWPGFTVCWRRVGKPPPWPPGWNPPIPGGPPPPQVAIEVPTTPAPTSSSTATPWAADVGKVNEHVARLEVKTDVLAQTVKEVRDDQKDASSSLRLMSLRMGLVDPDMDIASTTTTTPS